jgi:hypothetical protein
LVVAVAALIFDCIVVQSIVLLTVYIYRYLTAEDGGDDVKLWSELHPWDREVRVMPAKQGTLYIRKMKALHSKNKRVRTAKEELRAMEKDVWETSISVREIVDGPNTKIGDDYFVFYEDDEPAFDYSAKKEN